MELRSGVFQGGRTGGRHATHNRSVGTWLRRPLLGSHDSADYLWCAIYTKTSGAGSCYYTSYRQCMVTTRGIGGTCVRNPHDNAEPRWEPDRAGTEPCPIQRGRFVMRKLLLGTLILAATVATGPRSGVAQNYPWCVVNDQTGTTSCRFVSREQCLASTGGNVGHCVGNPASPSLPAPVRGSRRPNG